VGVAFGGSGIIRGVAFGWSGIIRGVAFGGSDLIKEGLVYQMIPIAHRDTSCAETPCGFNNELLCASDESNFATLYYRSNTGKIGII
jgi:hypothetical protein